MKLARVLRSNRQAWALLLTAMVIWGSSFMVIKLALDSIAPMTLVWFRLLIGLVAIGGISLWLPRPTIHKADLPALLLMALFEPCLYFLFETHALAYTSSAAAGVAMALLPLAVALASAIFLQEPLTLRSLWLVVSVAGAILLALGATVQEAAPRPILGSLLLVGAILAATAYTVVIKRLIDRYSVVVLIGIQCLVGTLFYTPIWWLLDGTIPNVSLQTWIAVLYLGCVVTLGAYGLFTLALTQLPATAAGAATNVVPVVAVLLGVFLLDEQLTGLQWLGIAAVFSGLIAWQQSGPRPENLDATR